MADSKTIPAQFIQEAEEAFGRAQAIRESIMHHGVITKQDEERLLNGLHAEVAIGHLAAHIAEVKMIGRQRA